MQALVSSRPFLAGRTSKTLPVDFLRQIVTPDVNLLKFSCRFVLNPFDGGSQSVKSLVDSLVAAVNLLDVVNNADTLS